VQVDAWLADDGSAWLAGQSVHLLWLVMHAEVELWWGWRHATASPPAHRSL